MAKQVPFSLIFLSGGQGTRMKSRVPKQYLPVHNQPLMLYSFRMFLELPEVQEIIVVCEPAYRSLFQSGLQGKGKQLLFALPGKRRQDSLFNGIQLLTEDPLVCIHDAARPLIQAMHVRQVVQAAEQGGAATLGVKVQSTIKICEKDLMVKETPDREILWEIQTPQVVRLKLLKEGFARAHQEGWTVTDDVSLVERLRHPVKVVEGAYSNIKVTTPQDLRMIERLIDKNALL